MNVALVLEWATLGVSVLIGLAAIFVMRKVHMEQQEITTQTVNAVAESQKQQKQFTAFLQRLESDNHALQKVALQVEAAVAALKENIGLSMDAAAERQTGAIEVLRDHIDTQEDRLARILDMISESLLSAPQLQQNASGARGDNTDYSRLRRQTLGQDPELRFSVLKDWVSINAIGILHRAARGWNSPNDLIANVPSYLQPEAEVLNATILLIGTREYPDRLAIALRALDSTSDFGQWFDQVPEGQTSPYSPAVLMRSHGRFKLVSKGTNQPSLPN
jgi:hypothetical protein